MRIHTGRIVSWIILLASFGFLAWFMAGAKIRGENGLEEETNNFTPPKVDPIPVKIQILESGPVVDQVTWPAVTKPWEDVELTSSTQGIVNWVGLREGMPVKSGQAIARVETETLMAVLEQARSVAQLARIQFDRTSELVASRAARAEELDQMRDAVVRAEATLAIAREDLRHATVISPIEGIVERLDVERGERLGVGMAVARIVNINRLKTVVAVPERDVANVRLGDPVVVTMDGLPGHRFQGIVSRVALVADPVTRTFDVEVEVCNEEGLARAGMLCRATFVRNRSEKALVIPLFAVMRRGINLISFVESDGVAQRRVVVPGSFQQDRIEIVSGLRPGDRLIVVGQRDLQDGQPVTVAEELPSILLDPFATLSAVETPGGDIQ